MVLCKEGLKRKKKKRPLSSERSQINIGFFQTHSDTHTRTHTYAQWPPNSPSPRRPAQTCGASHPPPTSSTVSALSSSLVAHHTPTPLHLISSHPPTKNHTKLTQRTVSSPLCSTSSPIPRPQIHLHPFHLPLRPPLLPPAPNLHPHPVRPSRPPPLPPPQP